MSVAAMDVLNHTAVTEIPVVSRTVPARVFTDWLGFWAGSRDGDRRGGENGDLLRAVESGVAAFDGAVPLDDLRERVVGDGSADGDDATVTDLVYALRTLGYEDAGNPGTPVFRPSR